MSEEVSATGADGPLLDKAGAAALLNVSVRTVEAWIAQRRTQRGGGRIGPGRRCPSEDARQA